MNILQLTPGAGGMYCGGCFRDNALVAALRKAGHEVLMVPLYLPLTLDEPDQTRGVPIFFSGLNVYLEQKFTLFSRSPRWLHQWLASPRLLKWASGRAAKTRPQDLGDLTLSMIRGEEGRQARELDELIAWLATQPRPDVICLSNALLIGLARKLKAALQVPVACLLSGEDSFLDALPAATRDQTWRLLAARCSEADLFLAPSRYYADLMSQRLSLRPGQVRVLPNGINLAGYDQPPSPPQPPEQRTAPPPALGFFARMSPEKGLDLLVDAFLLLKQLPEGRNLRLHVGGSCGPADVPFVDALRRKLAEAGVAADVSFQPNLDRNAKLAFYRGLTVFSTPALYGEAFGLYLLEALAAGVPIVQPNHAAFPEIVQLTGGGILCAPGNPEALAEAIAGLLRDPEHARLLGERGREAVHQQFTAERQADELVNAFRDLIHPLDR